MSVNAWAGAGGWVAPLISAGFAHGSAGRLGLSGSGCGFCAYSCSPFLSCSWAQEAGQAISTRGNGRGPRGHTIIHTHMSPGQVPSKGGEHTCDRCDKGIGAE